MQTEKRVPREATWSLVLGIIGLFIAGLILGIIAIVLSVKAKKQISANPQLGGEGRATAGLILGILGVAGWAIAIATLV